MGLASGRHGAVFKTGLLNSLGQAVAVLLFKPSLGRVAGERPPSYTDSSRWKLADLSFG